MLLEFRAKNFKSFKDELAFSMIPAPKQKGLDYSILKETIGNEEFKALSSSVIYGANASGKTNIISAMDVFKNIILHGNIKNNLQQTPNAAVSNLEIIPNIDSESSPIYFYIKFIDGTILFEYELSFNIGTFLSKETTNRKILLETLSINKNLIFSREDSTIVFEKFNVIDGYLVENFKKNEENLKDIAKNNINKEELFLTNGFKTMFRQSIVNKIIDWLSVKFRTICMSNTVVSSPVYDQERIKFFKDENSNNAAKEIGSINDIGYFATSKDSIPQMVSIPKKNLFPIPSAVFESYGTIRFLNLFPIMCDVLYKGGTLIVDEFDASLHPMVVMNIINIFHNNDINIKKAQLIFNTHNPIFLNSNLFRRDEIKFVERTDDTHISEIYSLSDFGTEGKYGVRNGEDYMKNYFINKYGAIKNVEFETIVKRVLGIND